MLKINRLRIEINTIEGTYGIDETFSGGLNFIASLENTCGKSSMLAAIYYSLGFEQILGGAGGVGSKVLTSVFKNTIDADGRTLTVTESGVFLEISNGNESITIYRNIKSEMRNNSLVSVYYGLYDEINKPSTISEDFYVNVPDGATSKKGFHAFLENFIHLELPLVRTSDSHERKLYLQVIFSSMFIEQKNGWSAIMSGLPTLGIRESKRRVIEFVLGLDTLKNEKERDRLNLIKIKLEHEWEQLRNDVNRIAFSASSDVNNFPLRPRVLSQKDYSRVTVTVNNGAEINNEINRLQAEYESLGSLKPRVLDNFELLNNELTETETSIFRLEHALSLIIKNYAAGNEVISRLTVDLDVIKSDIRNNKDAARLQKFGSEVTNGELSVDVCPTCKQNVHDNLLAENAGNGFMTIEQNIRHLEEQKKMLEFTLNSRKKSKNDMQKEREGIESKLQTLRRLANSLRSDLNTTTDTDASEALMLKKIEISNRIGDLSKLSSSMKLHIEKLEELSNEWNEYLDQKGKLPSKDISADDVDKINSLKMQFIANLKRYGYKSLSSFDGIDISRDSLLPTIDGFDMKYDSSASDNVRVIWAFTMALLQVSIDKNGNHPKLLIIDEPAQQSIISEDMGSFIDSTTELEGKCQIITAITLNSVELLDIVNRLEADSYQKIDVVGKAFKLLKEHKMS